MEIYMRIDPSHLSLLVSPVPTKKDQKRPIGKPKRDTGGRIKRLKIDSREREMVFTVKCTEL
jgi:hypothetical protein